MTEGELRAAIDALAQRIQAMHLMATELRREAGRSLDRAIDIEGQIDQCARILKRLHKEEG